MKGNFKGSEFNHWFLCLAIRPLEASLRIILFTGQNENYSSWVCSHPYFRGCRVKPVIRTSLFNMQEFMSRFFHLIHDTNTGNLREWILLLRPENNILSSSPTVMSPSTEQPIIWFLKWLWYSGHGFIVGAILVYLWDLTYRFPEILHQFPAFPSL